MKALFDDIRESMELIKQIEEKGVGKVGERFNYYKVGSDKINVI